MKGRSVAGRSVLLALVVVVLGGLAFGGCLGPAVGGERITAYDVTAIVREDRTVEVREVIDWDFGGDSRHGIYRLIPSSGGTPTDIEVSSPTAPDQAEVSSVGTQTEVRVGDPAVTISGRHRYVLTYVLPATIVEDRFALNAIGTELEVGIERATVTILGADLADPRCFTGPQGATDRCDVEADGDAYRAGVDDLGDHEGVTIDGDLTATRAASLPDTPAFVGRDGGARAAWALVVTGLGAVVAAATYLVCRQAGRNEVAAGGATAAAFDAGTPTDFGPSTATPAEPPPPVGGVDLVPDSRMGELAGLEFVPPKGVQPWQAAVVLREAIDAETVGAWFSSLAAHDIVTFTSDAQGTVLLRPGPRAAEADPTTAAVLNRALGRSDEVRLGSYDPEFAAAWTDAGRAIDAWVLSAGIFRRRPPRFAGGRSVTGSPVACLFPAVMFVVAGGSTLLTGLRSGLAAVGVGLAVPGLTALAAYLPMTRSLSAAGSAIALRSESFRRFLHDSEAQHVEWAWQNGLLREYSAWAVALGEATAWGGALAASSVPPAEAAATSGVLYPAIYPGSFHSTTTAPAPTGGGGGGFSGGGFSGGGFSGGGGGGGGGGSW